MSGTQPEGASATKPKRSVVERVIVQGGIAAGLVLLAIEGWPYLQLRMAHSRLSAEMKQTELDRTRKLTKAGVDRLLGRAPDDTKIKKAVANGEERYDIYYFNGLLKQRELCVHYGVQGLLGEQTEPEVVEVTTIIPDELLSL